MIYVYFKHNMFQLNKIGLDNNSSDRQPHISFDVSCQNLVVQNTSKKIVLANSLQSIVLCFPLLCAWLWQETSLADGQVMSRIR